LKAVVVIGGGITGAVAAHALAARGRAVRLIESRRLAAMASGWTLGGVRQSGRDRAEVPLARAAVALWPRLADRLGHETGYHQHGNLRLARTPEEAGTIAQLVEMQKALGLDLRLLADTGAIRAIAPAIESSILAASFCPTDGYADPIAATRAFAEAASLRGARIEEGVAALRIVVRKDRIEGVETAAGFIAAERVILAAGTHSAALLAPLGIVLPLRIMQVQVVLSVPQPLVFRQVFGVANADCAGRQQPDGRFRYTSGIGAYPGDPERWSEASLAPPSPDITALRHRVGRILPAVAEAPIERSWGGLIDMTPDGLPVIAASRSVRGLVIAAGFSGHGFGIAPVTGELAAALASDEATGHDLTAFRLDRFDPALVPASLTLHG
jgi:sarcosine oxidase, subunit beta